MRQLRETEVPDLTCKSCSPRIFTEGTGNKEIKIAEVKKVKNSETKNQIYRFLKACLLSGIFVCGCLTIYGMVYCIKY